MLDAYLAAAVLLGLVLNGPRLVVGRSGGRGS